MRGSLSSYSPCDTQADSDIQAANQSGSTVFRSYSTSANVPFRKINLTSSYVRTVFDPMVI